MKKAWCCIHSIDEPPPQLERNDVNESVEPASGGREQLALQKYCGQCHNTPDTVPPNFLYGGEERIKNNLSQCAQRLYVRLAMWDQEGGKNIKTPMPPVHALAAMGIKRNEWIASEALTNMRNFAKQLVEGQLNSKTSIESLTSGGYENLPVCIH